MRARHTDILIGWVWILYSSLEPEDGGGGQLYLARGGREPQSITGAFLPKERGWGWYTGEENKQNNAYRRNCGCGREIKTKQLHPVLLLLQNKIYIYLMVATEIYFLIPFERNYVNQTNNVFLDDKNEANDMKTDLPEAANKFHKSGFHAYLEDFLCA